jgi:hypothetical protein
MFGSAQISIIPAKVARVNRVVACTPPVRSVWSVFRPPLDTAAAWCHCALVMDAKFEPRPTRAFDAGPSRAVLENFRPDG